MTHLARRAPWAALLLLAALPARADTTVWGIPAECQLGVVECPTDRDAATRPPPRILSSIFMQDHWTRRAYDASPDGATLLVHLEDGVRLVRGARKDDYALDLDPDARAFAWHPDSKRVAVLLKSSEGTQALALAVLDVTRLPPGPVRAGGLLPLEVVHRVPPDDQVRGLTWSPDGRALLVHGTHRDPADGQRYGSVVRVSAEAPFRASTVVLVPAALDLLRCGPGSKDWSGLLLYGHARQLHVIGETGDGPRRLPGVPSTTGLFLADWTAARADRLLVFYRSQETAPGGQPLQGVYLLDLARLEAQPAEPPELLYGGDDLHSLWLSPRGTYASWAGPLAAYYRACGAKPADSVEVTIPTLLPEGERLVVKGLCWSADESKLAITAGNRLYVHEVATRALYLVAEVGVRDDTFVAQPTWIGDRVVVASYEDAVRSMRARPRGDLWGPRSRPFEKDPTQGRGSSTRSGKPPGGVTPPKRD